MSGKAAFEVQGYAGGVWRTLRVCGDEEDAVAEAKGTRANRKYLSVRVTTESYNEDTGKFLSRVVYRHSLLAPEQRTAPQQPLRTTASPPREALRQRRAGRPAGTSAAAVELAGSGTIAGMLVWRLGLVALIGLSLVLALQQFRQMILG